MNLKQRLSRFQITSRLVFTALSAAIIIAGSYIAIRYAQGDFRITKQGVLPKSGLLAANSFPPGAQVYVNDKLVTATDDTIYLAPDTYQVKIIKDGYSPWQKTLQIKEEVVAQTNAQLFPAAPSITPLTFTGAENLLPSPDGRKLIYYTASASAKTQNGLYVLDLATNLNPFQKSSRQIVIDEPGSELDTADFIWSPDSNQVMILTPDKQILTEISKKIRLSTQPDISFRRKQILSQWEEEMYLRERQYLAEFPPEVLAVATQSAKNVYISPDKKRLLYTATASATLPDGIVPPIPGINNQPQNRQLEPGHIYVYDREEDTNFHVADETGQTQLPPKSLLANDLDQKQPLTLEASPSAFTRLQVSAQAVKTGLNSDKKEPTQPNTTQNTTSKAQDEQSAATSFASTATNTSSTQTHPLAMTAYKFNSYHSSLFINTLQWFSDSKHLIFVKDDKIQIMEYDGTNNTTLYSGPFAHKFIYPWPDGSRIIMLTSFSPNSPKNLYAIELKQWSKIIALVKLKLTIRFTSLMSLLTPIKFSLIGGVTKVMFFKKKI